MVVLDRAGELVPELATDDDIIVDDAQLATTTGQLDEVELVLDSLPAYVGTDVEPAQRGPCATDSGGLFQPDVSRTWRLDGGRPDETVRAVGDGLAQHGWTVTEPNQFGDRELTFDPGDGWQATGVVFPTFEEDAVVVEVRMAGATPCRLP